MVATHAEPQGYLAVTQTPDGIIHLISSGDLLPLQPRLAASTEPGSLITQHWW